MYINEIPSNTNITIKCNDTIHFLTSSIKMTEIFIKCRNSIESKLKSKILIVELVEKDGKTINFNSNKIKLDVETIIDNKSYIWHNVIISTIDIPNYGKYHIIISNNNINYQNRRNNFRVYLGLSSTIMIGYNNKTIDAIVKDLSNSGIGLIINSEEKCGLNENIRVSFDDSLRKASFHLDCSVVRIEDINTRKKLLGCTINNIKPNPNYYLSLVQRESLKTGK